MGGFGNIARGLGQFGADIGSGAGIVAEQKRKNLEDQFKKLHMQMEWSSWQQRAKEAGIPKVHGTFTTPDGSVYAVMTDPATGEPSTRQIHKSSNKYPDFRSLQEMESWAITHDDQPLLKQAQDAVKATQKEATPSASVQEYTDWKKALGREPSPKEVADWHRQPKAGGDAGESDEIATYAADVWARKITVAQVPAKARGKVLDHMRKNGMPLPPQLPPNLVDKLSQREASLDNTIAIIKDLEQDADLLEHLPEASLVAMAQSSERVPAALTRLAGVFQSEEEKMKISRLAGNLRSLKEHVNVIRAPLGATGFRGHEGWAALQAQSIQALASPGVNKQVLMRTIGLLEKLRDQTERVLSGEDTQETMGFTVGGTHYDIPAGQVKEFKIDHPDAKPDQKND